MAARQGLCFLFESTVMDGAPIFSMFRENLPTVRVNGSRRILNSTTNVILTAMEAGHSFAESLKKAQEIGVAEDDVSDDIEGWDAAVKVAALAWVVMGAMDVQKIERQGIRALTEETVRAARAQGHPYKLVCRASRHRGRVDARVGPERVPLSDPLAQVAGTSSVVYFETDIFPGLAIMELNPRLDATAYGMLADFLRAVAR